ncbi:hypothetical protein ACFLTH_06415 [Bacteroidota bacterium]
MEKSELQFMINEYFDGELEKNKEPLLFTHLSLDEESRDYFKQLNSVKNAIQDTTEEFPDYLEERILYSLEKPAQKNFQGFFNRNLFAVISYSVAIILIFVSVFFYMERLNYQNKYEAKVEQVNRQNQMIKLLYNSLPAAEVERIPENQIIVRAKM